MLLFLVSFLFSLPLGPFFSFFFFNETAPPEIYTYCHTLSLHDALPISSEEFLPPTWARSDRRRSRSQRTLLKAGTPGGFRYFSNLNPKESHRDGRPAPGVLCLRRHRHHRRDHRPQPADPVPRTALRHRSPAVRGYPGKGEADRGQDPPGRRGPRHAPGGGEFLRGSGAERGAGRKRGADAGRVRAVHRSAGTRARAAAKIGRAHV